MIHERIDPSRSRATISPSRDNRCTGAPLAPLPRSRDRGDRCIASARSFPRRLAGRRTTFADISFRLVREISIKDIPTKSRRNREGKGGRYVSPANCLNSCDSATFRGTIPVMNTARYLHSCAGIINRDTSRARAYARVRPAVPPPPPPTPPSSGMTTLAGK